MAAPAAQTWTGPPAPKRAYLRPLQLQSGPPLWMVQVPGVVGVYVKGALAPYGLEFLGGCGSGKSALILQVTGGVRLPVSYVELDSRDPAMAHCLKAAVRGAVWLTRQRGAWGRAHVHGDWSQAPSVGAVVSMNLWTSPAFADAEANVDLGTGPRVALAVGLDGAIHVGYAFNCRGGGARGRRGVLLM
jgi:hypothetical protein